MLLGTFRAVELLLFFVSIFSSHLPVYTLCVNILSWKPDITNSACQLAPALCGFDHGQTTDGVYTRLKASRL